MGIQGLRSTESISPTSRREGEWRKMILRLYPFGAQNAPLAALTAVMKSEVTHDPKFSWFDKRVESHRFKLAASLNSVAAGTAQSITIDDSINNAYGVKAGDVLMVEYTGELMYVSATPSADDTIAVLRGFENAGATTAVTYDGAGINPYIIKIGSAYEEGSAAPDPIGWDPTEHDNYTQIFREAFAATGTAMATRLRSGDLVRESKQDCLEAFQTGMERAFLFGKKRLTTRNGQPLRMTDGILNQLPAERKISLSSRGGILTLTYWETLIATMFRYGSNEKMAWCGITAILALTQMVRKNTQLNWSLGAVEKEYGLKVQRLTTPMGTIVLKVHPIFGQMMGGDNGGTAYTGLDNAMLILDMANLRYRYVNGRDVQYQNNMQLPGVDGLLAGYMAECGLELNHPETHLFVTGIKKGSADSEDPELP
jgi:hypothetical protein